MSAAAAVFALCCMTMCAAYLLFLAASWNAYKEDRAGRDIKIDELLARIPHRTVNDDAAGAV